VLSIAYVSSAAEAMSDEEIAAILVVSRANNVRLGLTGALLYYRGRFVQILEGPEEQVGDRFRKIGLDPRHRNIHVVSREFIEERQFPEWTMGFRTLSEEAMKQLDGFNEIFGRAGQVRIEGADPAAQMFLEWLGEYWFVAPGSAR
jgi:hypothetical protein